MTRFLVLFLLLFALLTGCGQAARPTPELAAPEAPQFSTEEDLLAYYADRDATKDLEVIDCVMVDDGAYDLVGVVQYDYDEDIPCALMFVQKDATAHFFYPVSGSRYEPAEDSVLTYLGNGEVTYSLFNTKTNKAFNCWTIFTEEDGKIDIEHNSESRS